MKHLDVTCAIIERDGLVLAAQRSAAMTLPLQWEFPGGKIHEGETAADCLKREIVEELGIRVEILRTLPGTTHQYPAFAVTLHPFVCAIESGEIILHEHAAVVWLPPAELPTLEWAAADIPVVQAYLAGRNGK